MELSSDAVRAESVTPAAEASLGATLWRVAWMATLLGLVLDVLVFVAAATAGQAGDARPFAADLVQKVSWGVIVCVAVALGSAATSFRSQLMGLLGLLAAPFALNVAGALHRAASQAIALTAASAAGPSPWVVGGLKGLEYGLLGLAVGWIERRPWGGLAAHAAVGLAAGLVFGGALVYLRAQAGPATAADLAAAAINEVLFPVGCALILFTAEALGRRARL